MRKKCLSRAERRRLRRESSQMSLAQPQSQSRPVGLRAESLYGLAAGSEMVEYGDITFVSDDGGVTFTYQDGADDQLAVALKIFGPLREKDIILFVDNWNSTSYVHAV